jgi:signal transduction histidine kinase/CheY-like chemotaxis protein
MSWEIGEPEAARLMTDFLAGSVTSVVMVRLGPGGEILDANPAFSALFPTWCEGDGRGLQDFLEPSEPGAGQAPPTTPAIYRLRGSMVSGTRIRGIHVPADGGSVLIGECLHPTSSDALDMVSATTNELARLNREGQRKYRESKRAQDQLELRYKLLVETTDQGMVWFNDEGRLLEANPAAMRIMGQAELSCAQDCLMRATGEDGHILARESHPVIHALRTGQSQLGVLMGIGDGPTWILLDALPETHPDGASPRIVCATFSDITGKKQAEEEKHRLQVQLQRSQKMESLGLLAGGVAHDMNNVLGAILGLASAHLVAQPEGTPLHQSLGTICKAAERGGEMVKSLLSFARQSPVAFSEVNLNGILKDEISLLKQTCLASIQVHLDLEGELRPVPGDAGALSRAIMNLCVNAADAMSGNGVLTLRTRNLDSDWIEVAVEDTGTGMSRDVLARALDPFFTTKAVGKGTGLGLSMAYSTVSDHHGRMEIESTPGQGTRVTLRFPACAKGEHAPTPPAGSEASTEGGVRDVLLVDDDDLVRMALRTIVKTLGHRVHLASSGEEALAKLEGGFAPDLVILDMNMPGLGGQGTLPRLRGLNPAVPVLLSTGCVDQHTLDLVAAYPGVTLLPKPFGAAELSRYFESLDQR